LILGCVASVICLSLFSMTIRHAGDHRRFTTSVYQRGHTTDSARSPVAPPTQARNAAGWKRLINAVVDNLKKHYVDHVVAGQMADALLAHEKNGEYDKVTDGGAFADLVTKQLRETSHDMHLELVYSPEPLPNLLPEPTTEERARYRKALEQDNCTFKKVEMLPHNIGYLKVNAFPDPAVCGATATDAMESLNNADALIFDLRENRGGYASMVSQIAAYLFDHPAYMYDPRVSPTAQSWTISPVAGNKLADKPVYVLTSGSTISAAEQFCYDLKMLKRATLVGATTRGSAHAGVFHRIDDHFGMGIPETRAINPFSKTDWEGTGVEPDVKVKAAEALETAEKLAESKLLFAGNARSASDVVLVGAKIYSSPTEPPIDHGSIAVHDGRIVAVGPSDTIKIPRGADVIDCTGLVVTAGFWNSHVHIMTPGLLHAEKLSSEQIASRLEEMLTRWGFTTVFDIASQLDNTTLIRRRIESGEVKGPRILTVGEPFWAKGGTPIYVKGFLETNHINIPEVESSAQAVERVRRQIRDGADGIKIFAGSIERDSILIMPLELAKDIVAEAHRAGVPVFAHPSNREGLEVAIQSGVDILAHTTASGGPWSASLVERMKAAHLALIATLTLWHVESRNETAEEFEKGMNTVVLPQLRAYSEAGGQILFGTDVGYIEQFDTSEEFVWMSRAGMSFQQILASLTTEPARRFGYSAHSGRVAKGMNADLVVLVADPAHDVTAFSKVRYTLRSGRIIYSQR
ncbi:MAG TPA: S41 family peptidase, partial [Candidatus Eremiobacteraceae bacterium]|nr:S41 family peptidase [Candidatus Eremiobacteraceae bacterium]